MAWWKPLVDIGLSIFGSWWGSRKEKERAEEAGKKAEEDSKAKGTERKES